MPRYGNPVVVSIERRTKGQCFFTLGWTYFVAENGVEEGDYLFFYFHGDRSVKVVVYDLFGCLKGVKETEQGSDAPKNKFEVIYKQHMQHQMFMPMRFSEAAELKAGGKALLQETNGKVWSVGVTARDAIGRQKRFSGGWTEFNRENGVEVGDIMSFFWKPNFIQVKIMKEGVVVID